ncbi:hypothetical protein Syun_001215 [Stephania yunnanensis]|uniref:Ycf2 N-terminal domain-containing protein n=1 Tax=Stephania yunnanensis TaxID=152371 RepID=A0AAP0Q696_9MAGN
MNRDLDAYRYKWSNKRKNFQEHLEHFVSEQKSRFQVVFDQLRINQYSVDWSEGRSFKGKRIIYHKEDELQEDPRLAYKLTNDLKEQERENEEESTEDRGIRSRKAKHVVIFTDNEPN